MKKKFRVNWSESHTGIIEAETKEEARKLWEEDTANAKELRSELIHDEIYEDE